MHSTNLLLEEPIRMASILEPSKTSFFPAMTKIVGTLGPKSRSVDTISACLKAGMSVARFDFSWGDAAYHQETLENLKLAIKATKKLCAVMLDTVGPGLQVVNKSETPISLEENGTVVLTPHQGQEATSSLLPINFSGLAKIDDEVDAVKRVTDTICPLKSSTWPVARLDIWNPSSVESGTDPAEMCSRLRAAGMSCID